MRRPSSRRDGDEITRLQAERLGNAVLTVIEELADAADELAVSLDLEPIGLVAGLHLNIGAELVYLLSGHSAAGDGNGLYDIARCKGRKLRALHERGNVLHDKVNTQVGLIGAVLLHCLKIGDAGERSLGSNIISAVLCKNRRQHILKDGENVLLRGEGHLHIELVELAGGPVAARVLIAEAGGDLEITVKAGGHKQLLELLRSLRQSIELAGVLSRGDKIVTRALGRGGGEYRRGNLKEAVLGHRLAQSRDDVAAEDDVLLDGGVSEVEIAVLEALGLISLAAAVYFKGQLVIAALAEDLNLLGDDLDIAGQAAWDSCWRARARCPRQR